MVQHGVPAIGTISIGPRGFAGFLVLLGGRRESRNRRETLPFRGGSSLSFSGCLSLSSSGLAGKLQYLPRLFVDECDAADELLAGKGEGKQVLNLLDRTVSRR